MSKPTPKVGLVMCPHCGDRFKNITNHFHYNPPCGHAALMGRSQPRPEQSAQTQKRQKTRGKKEPTDNSTTYVMSGTVNDGSPSEPFEPLGYRPDPRSDNTGHAEFTKISHLKQILIDSLSKKQLCALSQFSDPADPTVVTDAELCRNAATEAERLDLDHENLYDDDEIEEAFADAVEYDPIPAANNNQEDAYAGLPQAAYDSVFEDLGHGMRSDEDCFSLSLLNLMKHIKAPHDTYGNIIKLVETFLLNKVTAVRPSLRSRGSAIKHLAKRFQLESLRPRAEQKQFKTKRVEQVTHNAYAMTMSLLKSEISVEENMLFPNKDDPFGDLPELVDAIADIDTGAAFRSAYRKTKAKFPRCLPVGHIVYMDKLAIDRHGHISLEPVYFTLTLFTRKARNKPNAWRPLGYIPNLNLQSKAETGHLMKGAEKMQMYHDILADILRGMKELNDTGIQGYKFRYNGKDHVADLKFFFLVILGDTEAHDKLCGKKADRGQQSVSTCRHCNIPTEVLDDPSYEWEYTAQSILDDLVDNGDLEGLHSFSHHLVRTAWKQLGIKFGENPRGIHGVTPSEALHQVDLGMFKYEIKAFFQAIGSDKCKLHSSIDEWARCIGRFLLHQSDRKLPRTYFPNGISGGTKLAAHEQIGVLLVLHILLSMEGPCVLIVENANNDMTRPRLEKWRTAFGLQLAWRAWMKQDSIPMDEIILSTLGHQRLMRYVHKHAYRIDGMNWRLIKFHMIAHMTRNAIDFAVMANIDTSCMEHNHIDNAKNPAKGTQQRAYSIERQTALRYYENLVLQHATHRMGLVPTPAASSVPSTPTVNNTILGGSRFSIEMEEIDAGVGDLFEYKFRWHSKDTTGCYGKPHIDWVAKHVGREFGDGRALTGCTEHTRQNEIFRAHPSYRGGAPWHDWAMFEWADDADGTYAAPGQIVMFLYFPFIDEPIWFDGKRFSVDTPGLYCLVECFDEPFCEYAMDTLIVEERSKEVRVDVPGWGNREKISDKCLYLISVDAIVGPVAAVPNICGPPGSHILVRPYESWAEGFTKYLNGFP